MLHSDWTISFYDVDQFRQFKGMLPQTLTSDKVRYVYVNHSRQEEQDERTKLNGNIRSTLIGGLIFASTAAVIAVALKVLLVVGLVGLAATPAGWVCAALAILIGSLALGIFIHHKYKTRHDEEDPTVKRYNYSHNFSISNPLPKLARKPKVDDVETVRVYQGDCFTHQIPADQVPPKQPPKPILVAEKVEKNLRFQASKKITIANGLPRREVDVRNPEVAPRVCGLDGIREISHVDNPKEPVMDPPDVLKKHFEQASGDLKTALDSGNMDRMLEAYEKAYEMWLDYTAKKLHKVSGNMWTPELYKMMASTHIGEEDPLDLLRQPLIDARTKIVSHDYKNFLTNFTNNVQKEGEINTVIMGLFKEQEKLIKKYDISRKLFKMAQYVFEYNGHVRALKSDLAHVVYKKIKSKVKDLTSKCIGDWKNRDVTDKHVEADVLANLTKKLDDEIKALDVKTKVEGISKIIQALKDIKPIFEQLGNKGLMTLYAYSKRREHFGNLEGHIRSNFYHGYPAPPVHIRHSVKEVIPAYLSQVH